MDLYTLGEKKCALYAVIPDNGPTFNFLVSLLYAQAFQTLYYSADQIHHRALPCHAHFVLDELAAMPLPGFTQELTAMRSRNISASTIIQNMAQIKELYFVKKRSNPDYEKAEKTKSPLTRNHMKLERRAKRMYALAACLPLAVSAPLASVGLRHPPGRPVLPVPATPHSVPMASSPSRAALSLLLQRRSLL